jgi:hypothetical protein
LFKTIDIPPDPQSQLGQANQSPAQQIQIKLLGFIWFYSLESRLIKGLQRYQIAILSPSPYRQARFSDECDKCRVSSGFYKAQKITTPVRRLLNKCSLYGFFLKSQEIIRALIALAVGRALNILGVDAMMAAVAA